MARFGKRGSRNATAEAKAPVATKRKKQAQGARIVLSGPAFEEARKQLTHTKGFPRAFYAFSLVNGYASMDGDDDIGKLLSESGPGIRLRIADLWQKLGHVLVEYEGKTRLGVLVE